MLPKPHSCEVPGRPFIITTCQKINDADWKRPELKSIQGGILAEV
jgi:hypothetical protein